MVFNAARTARSLTLLAALASGAGCVLMLGGCFGYNNVERIEGSPGFENPNSPPVPQAMATALQWVVLRYPPGVDRLEVGQERPKIAINFPVATRRDTCEYVCRNVDRTAGWAVPLTTETDTLPVYHIGRVWTRGLYATVDIYRPATQLGPSPTDQTLYQCITVQLRSGIGSYDVYSHRIWPIGALDVPGLHYLAPGEGGRTQPSPNEGLGKVPPLPGEPRTRATGADVPPPGSTPPAATPPVAPPPVEIPDAQPQPSQPIDSTEWLRRNGG